MILILLVGLALGAYSIGVAVFIINKWTTTAEKHQKCKVIPAEVVLITIPINVGLSMNEKSAYRLINDDEVRVYALLLLVLVTILVYIIQLHVGKGLHARNQESAFCESQPDKVILKRLYKISFVFISFALAVATL